MKTLFISMGTVLVLVTGCKTPDHSPGVSNTAAANNARDQITASQTALQKAATPLQESSDHIDAAKTTLQTGADPKSAVTELTAAQVKLEEGKNLVLKASYTMDNALISVTQAVASAESLKQRAEKAEKERDKLKNDLSAQSAWVFKLLLGIAAGFIVAGIGLCVASMLIGFASVRIGIMVSAAGVALLILTLTLQTYKRELIIGCAILLLLTAAYFIWQLLVSAKANKELVQFGEAVKAKATPDLKAQLFGDDKSPIPHSVANSLQSDSTQAIVRQVRQHLKIESAKKPSKPKHI